MTIKNIPKLPLLGVVVTVLGVTYLIASNYIGVSTSEATNTKSVAAHHNVQTSNSFATAATTGTPATTGAPDTAGKSSHSQSSKISSGSSTTTPPAQTTSSEPSAPSQPSTPVVTPPSTVYLTLHPENGTTSTFAGYQYFNVPYTVPSSSTFTYATNCTIVNTPLLDNGIWCNGQTKGAFVSVQYDPAVASGHYTVEVTVQLDGVDHTATCDITL